MRNKYDKILKWKKKKTVKESRQVGDWTSVQKSLNYIGIYKRSFSWMTVMKGPVALLWVYCIRNQRVRLVLNNWHITLQLHSSSLESQCLWPLWPLWLWPPNFGNISIKGLSIYLMVNSWCIYFWTFIKLYRKQHSLGIIFKSCIYHCTVIRITQSWPLATIGYITIFLEDILQD